MSTPYRTSVELDMEATVASLAAENERLRAALKHAEGYVVEQAERYARELTEAIEERDRARAIAIAFEQQLAQVQAEMASLERSYEQLRDEEPTAWRQAALDAVYDCSSAVEVATDVIGGDMYEAGSAA